jgi:hypothetical protein
MKASTACVGVCFVGCAWLDTNGFPLPIYKTPSTAKQLTGELIYGLRVHRFVVGYVVGFGRSFIKFKRQPHVFWCLVCGILRA